MHVMYRSDKLADVWAQIQEVQASLEAEQTKQAEEKAKLLAEREQELQQLLGRGCVYFERFYTTISDPDKDGMDEEQFLSKWHKPLFSRLYAECPSYAAVVDLARNNGRARMRRDYAEQQKIAQAQAEELAAAAAAAEQRKQIFARKKQELALNLIGPEAVARNDKGYLGVAELRDALTAALVKAVSADFKVRTSWHYTWMTTKAETLAAEQFAALESTVKAFESVPEGLLLSVEGAPAMVFADEYFTVGPVRPGYYNEQGASKFVLEIPFKCATLEFDGYLMLHVND